MLSRRPRRIYLERVQNAESLAKRCWWRDRSSIRCRIAKSNEPVRPESSWPAALRRK